MTRRRFLKFLLGLTFFKGTLMLRRSLNAKEFSLLAVSEGKDYEAITKQAISAVGGIEKFVRKGDVVVIKPNIAWDRKPEYGATTHPLVVKAIANECLRAGARKVKVFDNTCNDARRCYETSGMQAILKDIKEVELKYVQMERFKNMRLNGVFLKEWEIYDEALSADVFINVPIAKHHSISKLTLGLKNTMGVMGGNRGYIHRNLPDALSDLNSLIRSHLVVIDATRILLNHGPTGGDLKDVRILNKVIVSQDIVAADAFATTLFGLDPNEIPTTVAAYRRGLGEIDLTKIKVLKV